MGGGALLSILETHTAALLQRPLLSPWACRGSVQRPVSGDPVTIQASPGAAGGRTLHLAPLSAVLLEEVAELGAGCPMAGALAQAFRGHLLDPGVRVQQVLGAAEARGQSAGVGETGAWFLAGQGLSAGDPFSHEMGEQQETEGPRELTLP